MTMKAETAKCSKSPDWPDRSSPAYRAGMLDCAARVSLDMSKGHLYAAGWLEERLRQEPPSLKRH